MSLPVAHAQRERNGHLVLYAPPDWKRELARFKPWQFQPRKSDRYFTVNRQRYKLTWKPER